MKSKKVISYVLAFTLALGTFSCLPELTFGTVDSGITVSAADNKADAAGFVLSKDSDGYYYVSDYKGKGGAITIPKKASYIGEGAFKNNTTITSVTFPEGTAEMGIGNEAFAWCTNIKKVTISGDIGSNGVNGIGAGAFKGCHSLRKVDFTNKDAYVAFIGEKAFLSCYFLTSINLPSKTQLICDDAFGNCASLSSIKIPAKTKIEGRHTFGYMYGAETADEYYSYHIDNNEKAVSYVKADDTKAVYWEISAPTRENAEDIATAVFGKNSFYMWGSYNEDGYFDADSYSFCVRVKQKQIVLQTTAGSPAEKWAKENGIKYKSSSSGSGKTTTASLDAPANLEAATSKNSVTLIWDDVKGASAYRVYIYNDAKGKYEKYKDVKNSKCKIEKLSAGKKYKFKVVGLKYNKDTKKYSEGEYVTISVTTKK